MLDEYIERFRGDILDYIELISFILDGYDNKNLKKIVNQKEIQMMGSREVSDRNRNIVLKNLKTKKNLFIIFNLWNRPSKKRLERKKTESTSEKEYSNLNNNELSEFLYEKIELDGMEETLYFWEKNKSRLIDIQKENLSIVRTKEENINIDSDKEQVKNNEKKHEKERKNWQISNNKLNQKLKKLNEEILRLESEKNFFQKKEQKVSMEFILYKKETALISDKLNKCLSQRDKLNSELIQFREEINRLQEESLKRQEIINIFKEENSKLLASNKAIIKRNEMLEQQKEEKINELELLKKQSADGISLNSNNSEDRIRQINVFLIGKSNFTIEEINKLNKYGIVIIDELSEKLIFEKVKKSSFNIWILDYGTPEWIKLKILRDKYFENRIKVISNHTKLIGELNNNGCIL